MAVWSEISLSDTRRSFGRLDSEFYQPVYLANEEALSHLPTVQLRQIRSRLDVGHVGPMVSHYAKDGVLFLQTQNVKPFFLDLTHSVRIDRDFHNALPKSMIRKGDVLLARSGSFGTASIYLDDDVVNAADIIIVSVAAKVGVDPRFLVAFMNSRFGVNQLLRFASGGLQGHVNLHILENFIVPRIEDNEQKRIAKQILSAYKARVKSETAFSTAKQLLSEALSLDALRFERPLSYTANFSEVMAQGRADADYFQIPYVQLRERILESANGYIPLTDLCEFLKPNIDPSKAPKEQFHYVELADINSGLGLVDKCESYSGAALPSRARRQVKAGDVLASAVVGSIDKSAVVGRNQNDFIASTGFFHLRPKPGVPSEFLLMLMRSPVVQMQLKQQATGGILSSVPDSRVKYVLVPRVDVAVQKEVAKLVKAAHKKHGESLALLEEAKARVEQLIEEAANRA